MSSLTIIPIPISDVGRRGDVIVDVTGPTEQLSTVKLSFIGKGGCCLFVCGAENIKKMYFVFATFYSFFYFTALYEYRENLPQKKLKGQKISQKFLISRVSYRAGEPENFLAAPAPDFIFKRLRLRLLIFFPSGSGYFFRAAPAPAPRGKKTRLRLLTIG